MTKKPAHRKDTLAAHPLWRWLGSMPTAVTLIVTLAVILALATRYESLYNTQAAQRVFYRAWWFQTLLGFLALNLIISALSRWPWKKHHIGFVLTHVGIITILVGGVAGMWWGVEGQLIIPEGQTERLLDGGQDQIILHVPNPEQHVIYPVDFASRPRQETPRFTAQAAAEGGPVTLTVDRYFPNAKVDERVTADGEQENPAVQLTVGDPPSNDQVWLFARDQERFGFRWGEAHLLFLEAATPEELARVLEPPAPKPANYRGVLRLQFPERNVTRDIPVKAPFDQPIPVKGTPYTLTIKQYLPDFAITPQGVQSRSEEPNNPALAFLIGDEQGAEPHLAFALHPDFETMHKSASRIPVHATYLFDATPALPPSLIGIVKAPNDAWHVVMTSADGRERKTEPLVIGQTYTHPWLHYVFSVAQAAPRARLVQDVSKLDDEVRNEAVHVALHNQDGRADGWVFHGNSALIPLGKREFTVSFGAARTPVPFEVKLVDFRKKTYPGLDMAESFESDVELHDAARGVTLARTISMNHPLLYRGYKIFQSGYQDATPEISVFSVRKDPGVPLVYMGCIVVVLGIAIMFYWKTPK